MFTNMWNSIKAWFNYSWSIFIARMETLFGLLATTVAAMDLTTIITGVQSGITRTQVLTVGGILFVKGLISEIGRRAGTVALSDGQLLPAKVSAKKEAVKVITKKSK